MSRFLSLLTFLLAPIVLHAGERPPNVVLIFADDLGYADLSCFDSTTCSTPNLDKLAAEGVKLTRFYSAQAVCSASRAALLTGCYPNRIGILGALSPASRNGIADEEKTLGEMFKERGYATAIVGKWHLGHQPRFLPTRHGFDEYFGIPYSNDMLPNKKNNSPPLPLIDGEKIVETSPSMDTLTARYTERAVRFINTNKDKPFFLYVPHTMVHVPLGVSERFKGKSKKGMYADVVAELDWSVGEIMTTLEKNGLTKDTIVIFTSDNGPWLNYGNHAGSAGFLREGKGTSFEGGVRVPFIARWPGKMPAGVASNEACMTIDIMPTLAHICGGKLPEHKIDGRNLADLWLGKDRGSAVPPPYAIYWGNTLEVVMQGKWKLHFPHSYRTLEGGMAANDGKAGTYKQAKIELSLFDLDADPGETTNLAQKYPQVVRTLQKHADDFRADLGDGTRKGSGIRAPGLVPKE